MLSCKVTSSGIYWRRATLRNPSGCSVLTHYLTGAYAIRSRSPKPLWALHTRKMLCDITRKREDSI